MITKLSTHILNATPSPQRLIACGRVSVLVLALLMGGGTIVAFGLEMVGSWG